MRTMALPAHIASTVAPITVMGVIAYVFFIIALDDTGRACVDRWRAVGPVCLRVG